MSSSIFNKDTLLDLSVNIIPLAILGFFFVVFVALNPWGSGVTLERVLQFILVGWMLVGLSILTYAAAKRIETGGEVETWHAGMEEHTESEAETESEPDAESEAVEAEA